MDLGLQGRKALVCGASKGLGFAVAQALLEEGAEVVVNGRRADTLEAAADRLHAATGRRPAIAVADLTVAADRVALVDAATRTLGKVELLLANAGGPPPGPFDAHGQDAWKLAIELALGSVTHLCALCLPGMREQGFGRIVQIVSIAGLEVVDGLILSNASRPAVLGFAKALAREVSGAGILVNSICPGIFLTDRIQVLAAQQASQHGTTVQEQLRKLASDIPVGRAGHPTEVGDLAAFLLSPRNGYITGAAVTIDGGKTRRLA